ncbi:trichohyalin isoform X2 [Nematostella vectensis]|uniref:trichohyalin isoform X2 n=1 Tax=Nematostella vectensis TaxID=45351 RepID=UPI0013905E96|nr:trichohyalin isoform X2 [Nematostella vectensis]
METLHEELLHLFAIHDAKYQTECERERQTAEAVKQKMQDELLMRASRRRAREAFEEERQRKIKEMENMMTGCDEESLAMAETNDKLSEVHQDLKSAFQIMQQAKEAQEDKERHVTEERKELLLQEIRRFPSKKKQKELLEQERQNRIKMYRERILTNNKSDETLVQVQEDLLKLFGKIKKDKKLLKETTHNEQEDRKALMHEELLHKTLSKQVSQQEAQERARRIKESKSELSHDDSPKQKAMDTLIDVQRQLLDVMSHVQMTSVKEQMHHLKFMNARANMLHEIRMRKSDHDIHCDTPSAASFTRPGRRLSIIGEQLQNNQSSSI